MKAVRVVSLRGAQRRVAPLAAGWRLVLLAALLVGCARKDESAQQDHVETPTRPPALVAPALPESGDLDLRRRWRAAVVRQDLDQAEERWSARPHWDLVILRGEAHRALLMLPSRQGRASIASFRVVLPATGRCEFVTWVALDPGAGAQSDGVDYAVGVLPGDRPPGDELVPPTFERLGMEQGLSAWREIRVDLSRDAGRTVWIVLAVRDQGERRGDWLLWGDPRVRLKDDDGPLVVDLKTPDPLWQRPRTLPWSEANVFKAYAAFNDAEPHADFAWMARLMPWLKSIRLFSSLGGNWGPSLEADYQGATGKNPTADLRPDTRWAKQYEFFRDGSEWEGRPSEARFDWSQYDTLIDRAASSRLALHIHLAGVPESFSGHKGYYQSYHYNELPVIDEAGWKTYVEAVFRHLSARPWYGSAHFSFFSEPNCIWIEGDGTPRHFGFQGTPEEYARQYLWTWQAMRRWVRPDQMHFGPWVVEPAEENPEVDNLARYVRAIVTAFDGAGEPLPPWPAFAFNVYETPQLTLDGLASAKIEHARRVLTEVLPGRPLPLRFDEVGIHPLVLSAFQRAVGTSLEDARWAATWHAEMSALMLEQGIEQGAPWVSALAQRAIAPYVFLSHVVHGVDLRVSTERTLTLARPSDDDNAPPQIWVRRAARNRDRLGYLWSSDAEATSVRLALWRYPRFIMSDARVDERGEAAPVEVRLPGREGDRWMVRVLRLADSRDTERPPESGDDLVGVTGLPKLLLRRTSFEARGRVQLTLTEADLVLIEAQLVVPAGDPQ